MVCLEIYELIIIIAASMGGSLMIVKLIRELYELIIMDIKLKLSEE